MWMIEHVLAIARRRRADAPVVVYDEQSGRPRRARVLVPRVLRPSRRARARRRVRRVDARAAAGHARRRAAAAERVDRRAATSAHARDLARRRTTRSAAPDAVILDTRSDGEYCGTTVRATRGGAIPGAVHIEWTRNLDARRRLQAGRRAAGDVRRRRRHAGPRGHHLLPGRLPRRALVPRAAAARLSRASATTSARGRNGATGSICRSRAPEQLRSRQLRIRPTHLNREPMNNVIDFINTNRDRYVDELKDYLAIPEHQRAAAARRPTCAAAPSGPPTRCAASACRTSADRDARATRSSTATGSARRARRRSCSTATTTCSRSIRSSCGSRRRSRRRSATARSTRAARRRQGPGLHALQGHRSAPEADRPAAGQHEGHPRGRGGSRLARNLDDFIRAHKDELAADVVVISDSPMFDRGIPSICYGLRGLVYFQIDLRGTKSDLHSGSFGGAVANPAMVLAQILAQMKDKRRPHQDSRASTTTCGALRDEERAEFEEAAVQRDAVPQGARRAEAVRRDAATRRSSACGAGRRSRSTACWRASPAKARRP